MRALLVATLLLAAPPAHAAVIARIPNESPVAAYRDLVVVSVRAKGAFRLALVRDGRVERLPVKPRGVPFDAAIGPDTQDRPVIAYSRCRDEQPVDFDPALSACDLYLHRVGSRGEERIRTASTPGASEYAPAVWRARIAYASTAAKQTRLLTRSRLERRTRMPQVLPGVRRDDTIREVALRERRIGVVARYEGDHGLNAFDVRLIDLGGERGGLLDRLLAGEGGQRFLGLSFAGPRLGWTTSCFGDPAGCLTRGPVRYRVDRGTTFRGERRGAYAGFALSRGGFVAVEAADDAVDGEEAFLEPDSRGACDDSRTGRVEKTCAVVREPR